MCQPLSKYNQVSAARQKVSAKEFKVDKVESSSKNLEEDIRDLNEDLDDLEYVVERLDNNQQKNNVSIRGIEGEDLVEYLTEPFTG